MTTPYPVSANMHRLAREDRLRAALFRGANLTLENPLYLRALRALVDALLHQDVGPGDLTVEALRLRGRAGRVLIRAKEDGVLAGLAEAAWIYRRSRLEARPLKRDGDDIRTGETILEVEGEAGDLLSLERLAVNLLQRMSGIATATKRIADAVRKISPGTHIVGTRKTPWGMLDKRALHLGGGGTHRLGLADAILIKTNHLALASEAAASSIETPLRQAWKRRGSAAFFEVEVTTHDTALDAARVLHDLQAGDADSFCPCLLMLDNLSSQEAARVVAALAGAGLLENVLVEASGKVSPQLAEAFAASGVDAISIGALTHSAKALDLSATVAPQAK